MKIVFSLAVLCVLLLAILAGQTITGSITGAVVDASGAIVPQAKITATNADTKVAHSTQSNEAGVYNLLFLPVGSYNVTAEASGFKKPILGPFRLEVNQIARVDIRLDVGDTTQQVEITAVAPILQTESSSTGDALTSSKLTSIPLNGRNFASLTLLVPGAVTVNPDMMNTSGRFQNQGGRPYVNGNREQTNNFLLDGVDVNDSIDNRIGYQPNVDALEEVKVITGNGGADFGNVGGAVVNMTLKSGTNELHGNVFEFLRNEKLDANSYFNNRGGARKNPFRRNIFGGTFGGPIVRNKAFFFVDYEGTEQRTSGPSFASVAPEVWRRGDLSDFLVRQNQVVRDPTNGQPFAGNIIPAARVVNPVARGLFADQSLYPLPNVTGTGVQRINSNYLSGTRNKTSNHQADAKVDYHVTDRDNISGRWSISRYDQVGSQAAMPVLMTTGQTGPTMSAVANWTRTISNRMVNDARIAYGRVGINDNTLDWSGLLGADGNQKFGITGGQPIPGLSSVTLGSGLSTIGSGAAISSTVDNKYQFSDNATYQAGRHLLKFGGQIIRFQQNRYYAGNNGALGSFTYNGQYSGIPYGDFLLNTLSSKGRGSVTGKWGHRHWRNALFIQDDWKVAQTFTLNLGMRWEYITPIYEVADRQVNINTYTGELLYPGKTKFGRALYEPYRKQFMPRIGLAWTPEWFQQKLVVRAGYAYTSFLEGTGANLRLPLNPPFFVESNVDYDVRTPGDIRAGFSDVIGRGDMTGPRTGANPFFQGRAWDLNLRPQFTQQMNFTLEYQVSATTSFNAGYVRQKGTHLVVPHEGNQPLPGTGPVASWAPLNDRRPLARVLPNVGNIALTEGSATMDYNALQLSGRRRLAQGLEFLAAYTFGKTLTDNRGFYGGGTAVSGEGAYWQNAYDRRSERGRSFYDARHNFTLGGLYQFPVGKGQKVGSGWSKAMDLAFGGWNVNYFISTHTGFPVTILANNHVTQQATRSFTRPNRYRDLVINTQSVDQWFGPITGASFCAAGVDDGKCAYGYPVVGVFGNSSIGTEQAPQYFNLDASIGKKFNVGEKNHLDFRVEFFNLFNHANFGPPGRDLGSPGTFGLITATVGSPRNIQFGLKYNF